MAQSIGFAVVVELTYPRLATQLGMSKKFTAAAPDSLYRRLHWRAIQEVF